MQSLTDGLRGENVNEAGSKQDEEDGQAYPGQIL